MNEFLLALGLDWLVSDPPNRFHPVAWMGQGIARAERHTSRPGPLAEFLYGLGLMLGGAAVVGSVGTFGTATVGV